MCNHHRNPTGQDKISDPCSRPAPPPLGTRLPVVVHVFQIVAVVQPILAGCGLRPWNKADTRPVLVPPNTPRNRGRRVRGRKRRMVFGPERETTISYKTKTGISVS